MNTIQTETTANTAQAVLQTLASVSGHVSIENGVATLPSGKTVILESEQPFIVEVCRTAWGNRDIKVMAINADIAVSKALDFAGNESFTEHDSSYEVMNVSDLATGLPVAYGQQAVPSEFDRKFFQLPSDDGSAYDLFALAPKGMVEEVAQQTVNSILKAVNAEDRTNLELGAFIDVVPVETAIKTRLSALGFTFLKPSFTQAWDI